MKNRLGTRGLRVADHQAAVGRDGLEAAVRRVGFPVIIKPALGTGSMNTHVFAVEDEFLAFLTSEAAELLLERPRLLVVEQYLDVISEVTCDGIVVEGEVVFALASRYTTPLIQDIGGMLGAVSLDHSDALSTEVTEYHSRAVEALGLVNGVTHLELLVTPGGIYVGEIACRPGGAGVVDNARLARDVDLWDAFIRTSLGWPLPSYSADAAHSQAAYLWSELPTRPGRVAFVSDEADFSHIEGLLKVDMHVRTGETISPRVHSSSTTGLVYFRIDSSDRRLVSSKLEEVAAAYRLELVEHDADEAVVMAAGAVA
jgi:biotin carboxylase